jgi:cobalamin biosynthesis protein CobD/CbiB
MTFLSLLVALLLEQVWPLRPGNLIHRWFDRLALGLESRFNGGQYRHGAIAWVLVVAPLLVATLVVSALLHQAGLVAVLAWSIAVLYLTLGFRQFGQAFGDIQLALQAGELTAARNRLGNWLGESAADLDAGAIARVAIEQGLMASHRCLFGILFWFAALGPAGAMLYRASALLADRWGAGNGPESAEFGRFAGRVFNWLDWAPARLTAASFAIVGDFEEAVNCWRTQAAAWPDRSQGVVLASGAGALGVRLGDPLHWNGSLRMRPGLGTGDAVEVDHMPGAAGLIWRSLVLWMFLVLVVSLARALG